MLEVSAEGLEGRAVHSNSSDRIVAEALSWVGTPYHHQADVKGRGVDCAMLLVRVFVDTGIVSAFDPRPYTPDWYMHRDEERFLGWIRQFGDPVPEGEALAPGDVALYKFGRCVSHGGIVVSPGIMVHADQAARRVVRCELTRWYDRFAGAFRVKA